MNPILQKEPIRFFTKGSIWTETMAMLMFIMVLCTVKVHAQVTVTVTGGGTTTPALATSYTSFANFTAALNAVTAMNGQVTAQLGAGNETAPVKGFTIGSTSLNAVLSATNQIIISGTNNTTVFNANIGTATTSSASPDGILKLVGADYVSIDSITFNDTNTASATTAMEFGIGLFKASATDGCNNNFISFCSFNMQRINAGNGPVGTPMTNGQAAILLINATPLAATTALVPTVTAGLSSDNTILANSVTGGNSGIILQGYNAPAPYTLIDTRNTIQANNIINFGGGGTGLGVAYGIITNSQWESTITDNVIDNNTGTGVNSAGNLYGIIAGTAANSNCAVNGNWIKLQSTATTGLQIMGINCVAAFGGNQPNFSVTVNNNIIDMSQPLAIGAASLGVRGISCQSSAQNVSISSNTIGGIGSGFGSIGEVNGIYYNGAATLTTINNNTIKNFIRTGASGNTYGIYARGSNISATASSGPTNVTANGNTIDNLSFTAADNAGNVYGINTGICSITNTISSNIVKNLSVGTSGIIRGILDNGLPGTKLCQNNQVFNFSTPAGVGLGGNNIYYGISFENLTNSAATVTISGNVLYSFNNSGTGTNGQINVISAFTDQPTVIFNNKIYDIAYAGTNVNGTVSGIINILNTSTIYNNVIADIRMPNYTQTAQRLFGIYVSNAASVYYNTIYLSGTNASSAALYASTSGGLLKLNNNILINSIIPNAGGTAAAYSRGGFSLTNYDASSNNNLFAGTNIYYDGTNTDATLAAFKTRMATRDQASVTETTTPFISTVGSSADFLRFPTNAISVANNAALPITSPAITTDYFGVNRSTSTPDIGASEFNGLVCTAPTVYALSSGGTGCVTTGVAVTLANTQTNVNYQLKLNGTAVGGLVSGSTGVPLTFGNQTVAGTYTVDAISNVVGCNTAVAMSGSAIVTLDPASVGGSVSGTKTICNGLNSGALTLSGNTGTIVRWEQATTPFTTWTTIANTTATYTSGALSQTTYFRAVSKNGTCPEAFSAPAIISVTSILATTIVTNVSCNGGANGAINLTPSGGTAPYTFNWGGGITTEDRTGLTAGIYSVTITDANNCNVTLSIINVTQPTAVSGTTVVTNVICNGGANGAINLTPSGGTAPYIFNWGGGITTEDRTGLAAGTYAVTITDANGCTATLSFNVIQPIAAISATTVITNVSCNGGTNGAINLTPSGGTAPYTFNWGGGVTTEDRTGLVAGTYSVTITDANGCSRLLSGIAVTQPTLALTSTEASKTNILCFGGNNGSATISASGGTAPYSYNWTPGNPPGDGTATIIGVTAAAWTCTITDANGCSTSRIVNITQPWGLDAIASTQTNISCFGGNNGRAVVSVANGTPPYTYDWTPGNPTGDGTGDATGLTAGNWNCLVTDANGCGKSVGFTIIEPAAVTAPTAAGQQFCGTATVANLTATGSNLKWYAVSTGGTPLNATTALANGNYFASQTISGCESVLRTSVAVTISTPTAPTATAQTFCNAATVANLAATGTGIKWYAASTGGTALVSTTALVNGNYFASQTINGCESVLRTSVAVTINAPTAPTATAQTFCNAATVANLVATGTGIKWYAASTGGTALVSTTALVNGNYFASQTISGCESVLRTSVAVTISTPTAPTATAQTFCNAATVANLAATGTGIKWYAASTGGTALVSTTALANGNYFASQTISGCESISRTLVDVTINPAPAAPVGFANEFCVSATIADIRMNSGTDIKWYETETGGEALATNTALTTRTYFASQTLGGCESISRRSVPVLIVPAPQAPVAQAQQFCNAPKVSDLIPSSDEDNRYNWYDVATGGEQLFSNTSLLPGQNTYYVSQQVGDCEGPRTAVAVTFSSTTWNGSTWSNGIPDSQKSAIFAGFYVANTDLTACSVSVSGTANVVFLSNTNLTVTNEVTVAASSTLTFENDSNLIQINTAANTGNITYNRDASMKRLDYTYWSSPVAGQTLLSFTPNTLVNRFYTFNEQANTFAQVASPAITNFVAAKGYSLRAPNNFLDAPAASQLFSGIYTGVPNNGDMSIPVTFTANQGIGYNLIGNPYPSTVSGTAFLTANTGSIYFWTHQSYYVGTVLTNGGVANYASMNLSGSVAATVNNGVNVLPNGFIQAGQGFMFLTTTNKNVTFTNAMRQANNAGQFFRTLQTAENNKIWLNLTNNEGAFSQTMVAYLQNTTTGFDDGYDAKQLNANGTILSSQIADENYAIQSRGNFNNADVVKLNLNIATAGNYTISKDNTNGIFSNAQDFYLKDNLLGLMHNIKQNPYNFVSNAGTIANRFEIVYQSTLLNNSNLFENASVIVFEQNGSLNVSATADLKSVKVFDIQGRNIFETKDINSKSTTLNGFRPQQQVLLLHITNSENQVVTKKVVF
jgi:hypothetical protein